MAQKLYRSESDKVIAGLCGGLGEFFDVDSTIIRIIFIILTIWGGVGIVIYLIGVFVVPLESSINSTGAKEKSKSRNINSDFAEMGDKIKSAANEIKNNFEGTHRRSMKGNYFLGCLIIFAGVILLIQNFFPKYGFHLLWPIAVILFGLYIISSGAKKGDK